jgi:hypothetical protein
VVVFAATVVIVAQLVPAPVSRCTSNPVSLFELSVQFSTTWLEFEEVATKPLTAAGTVGGIVTGEAVVTVTWFDGAASPTEFVATI